MWLAFSAGAVAPAEGKAERGERPPGKWADLALLRALAEAMDVVRGEIVRARAIVGRGRSVELRDVPVEEGAGRRATLMRMNPEGMHLYARAAARERKINWKNRERERGHSMASTC